MAAWVFVGAEVLPACLAGAVAVLLAGAALRADVGFLLAMVLVAAGIAIVTGSPESGDVSAGADQNSSG